MSYAVPAAIWVFPVAYYLVAGMGYTVFTRYMIPLVPYLCMAAGCAAARTLTCCRLRSPWRHTLCTLLVAAVGLPPLSRSIQFDRLLAKRDNRLVVADWMDANLPQGRSVLQTGMPHGHVMLPSDLHSFGLADRRAGRRPDFMLVQRHPLAFSRLSPELEQTVKEHYRLRERFSALSRQSDQAWYDRQDAFFLPFAGFKGIRRPGPNYDLYENKSKQP